jgi:hypothetical protein
VTWSERRESGDVRGERQARRTTAAPPNTGDKQASDAGSGGVDDARMVRVGAVVVAVLVVAVAMMGAGVEAQARWAAQAQLLGADGSCTSDIGGCDFSCQVSVNGVWSARSSWINNNNRPRCACTR